MKINYRRPILVYQETCHILGSYNAWDRLRIIMPDGAVDWWNDGTLHNTKGWYHSFSGHDACTAGKNSKDALYKVKRFVKEQGSKIKVLGNL